MSIEELLTTGLPLRKEDFDSITDMRLVQTQYESVDNCPGARCLKRLFPRLCDSGQLRMGYSHIIYQNKYSKQLHFNGSILQHAAKELHTGANEVIIPFYGEFVTRA